MNSNPTRRFVLALPVVVAATSAGAVTQDTVRAPYVRHGAWVRGFGEAPKIADVFVSRECKVLHIGGWDGVGYPVTTTGWFEQTHVIYDHFLNDYCDPNTLGHHYHDANERHWAQYDRALSPQRFLLAKRGLPNLYYGGGGKNPSRRVETELL